MEMDQVGAIGARPEVLLRAMEIALQHHEAPMLVGGDVLATACVVAAVLHPEWAESISTSASTQVRNLAEQIVEAAALR